MWDAASGRETLTLKGHPDFAAWSVAFSPDSQRLASASADTTVKVWDAATGREVLTLRGHLAQVQSVIFSPDGRRLVTGSGDGTVKVWDTASGQEALTLEGNIGFGNEEGLPLPSSKPASAGFLDWRL